MSAGAATGEPFRSAADLAQDASDAPLPPMVTAWAPAALDGEVWRGVVDMDGEMGAVTVRPSDGRVHTWSAFCGGTFVRHRGRDESCKITMRRATGARR